MNEPKGVTPELIQVVLSHLRYEHDLANKGRSFWQRFFGDDVSFSLAHIANRPDVCKEIAFHVNLAMEWQGHEQNLRSNPYAERTEDDAPGI